MPAPAPKKDALTKMAFGKPKGEPDALEIDIEGEPAEEADEGLQAACDEVFDAMKNDDRAGFCTALTAFVRLARED